VEYFHVELERHDVILAEGAPSETFIDDHSRGMFHNAAEFFSMYPNAPREAARYCAPRVESGEALQAIRARLAGAAAGAPMGRLRGRLDEVSRASVAGWAADGSGKVQLVVTDNGVVIGQVSAENFRADLAAAGIGTGCHGFDLTIPGGLSPFVRHVIEIRRSADGAILDNSPWVLEAVAVPVAHSGPGSTVRGRLDTATRERITGWAQDEADITQPVALQILDNGIPLARVLANRHRPDLAAAGIGSGWHSFDVILPGGLSPLVRHVIEVRRESDGAPLPGSPMVIAPEKSFSAEMQRAIAQAVAAVGSEGEREHVLSFIAAQAEQLLQQQADAEAGRVARLAGLRQSRASIASQDAELRALVIDERVPQAGRDGGSAAILSHIKALQALGYAVSLVAADDMTADSPALAALGVRLCRAPFYATVEEVLRRQSGCFDVVYLHRASVAARYLTLARAHASRGRLIYSIADLHHIRLERQAAVEDRPELFAQSRRLRLEEYRAAWAADAVITHSGDEAEWLRQAVPSANIHVVGWDFAPRRQPAPFASRHGVAFIGNYAHAPNLDAAHFLAEEVMPLVRQVEPEMTCLLVGDGAAQQVGHLAGGGIEVTGHVADLQDIFDRVRLTVAPLRFGAGLKGKVLESFAAGLPCVLTPIAAEGFSLAAAASDHISADAAGLAASICLLHRSQAMHDAAVQAGLALVETQYSAAAIQDGLRNAIAGSATGRGADKLLHHPPSFHAKINAR
jgi:glycosyltransferase involved in cell wall biosynthesis